ncbi:MAG TPA: hypothetical protein VEI55_03165 [Candidatus Acidoferrum sp.]|nr:hypothetical protein [Candidatus Acidoferrum sp.]
MQRKRKRPTEVVVTGSPSDKDVRDQPSNKKALILGAARSLGKSRFTPAEIEQIRRQLIAQLGTAGKTSPDYILSVLKEAGLRVAWSTRADSEERYEEEFADLLHFRTLDEAEMCLVRLDELFRKFSAEGDRGETERVREVARLGRRRAEMIARNRKVDERKRAEKEEIAHWFAIWLETPDAFFDWLEVRKQSPAFRQQFPPDIENES